MSALRDLSVAAFSLVLAGAANASLISFSNVNDTGEVHYNGLIEGSEVQGLSASTLLTLDNKTINSYIFSVSVTNNSNNNVWEQSRLSGFGFNVNPDVASVSEDDDSWLVSYDKMLPGDPENLEVCFSGNANSAICGTTGVGVDIGETVSFSMELFFNGALPATISLDNFGVRWQSLDSDQLNFQGDSGYGRPVAKVPEPAALGLFGLGFLGIALASRRRKLQ